MVLTEYVVSQRTKDLVAEKNMLVYPSENKQYKLEIYNDNGLFLGYIGLAGEFDYLLLLELVELRKISLNVANRIRTKWWKKNKKSFRENRKLKLEGWFLWS
jgi:hypothetical protein